MSIDSQHAESYVLERDRCPRCAAEGGDTTGDNLAIYNDGHAYCFKCNYYRKGNGDESVMEQVAEKQQGAFRPYKGHFGDLTARGISAKTARRYGYHLAEVGGKAIEFWNIQDGGDVVAQKVRSATEKKFAWRGNGRNPRLFGQHLFAEGGRRLIITEGEYDAMSVAECMENRYAVVSLPSGAASAVRDIKHNLKFVASFDEIILLFDNDEAGQTAAKAVAEILPPGKAKIAHTILKDANEHLMTGETKSLVECIFQAEDFSPDEILHVSEIVREAQADMSSEVWPMPWPNLSEFLIGQRSGEITLWTSGTGSGKSTIIRELMHHHLVQDRSVGAIMLEETPKETIDDMVSLMVNKPIRALRAQHMLANLRQSMGQDVNMEILEAFDEEEYAEACSTLAKTGLYVYNHEGHNAMANLLARMEYMAVSLNVKVIILDHITAAATSMMAGSEDMNNERLVIDGIMKSLRGLAVRTGVHIDVISQLKKSDKAYEEGSRITLQDLRGSGSLSSVPNTVIALERNRQDSDPMKANTTICRVLKNRLTGRAGIASGLYYDLTTGRLREVDPHLGDEGATAFNPV